MKRLTQKQKISLRGCINGALGLMGVLTLAHSATSVQAATYYYHNDHLGTPQALTDKDQNVVWQGDYDPFGQATETIATVEQNLRFPGQYLDRESGLHYNYFRTYNPEIGRYTQSDPIGLAGGINTYGYAYQSPITAYDPDGRFVVVINPWTVGVGIAMATAGAAWWATNNPWAVDPSQLWTNVYNNKNSTQSEKRPQNCPTGTVDIDKAKRKYGWDKDRLHGIKDAAHGGMGTGKSWTGVAPDGTVGINEGGQWIPQGHWEDLL